MYFVGEESDTNANTAQVSSNFFLCFYVSIKITSTKSALKMCYNHVI